MDETIFTSCLEKQDRLRALFLSCKTAEERYKKIIEIGKALPRLNAEERKEATLVPGCQSLLYLYAKKTEEIILFKCSADALISAGLAGLLIAVYSQEPKSALFKCPPHFLQDIHLYNLLSPGRSNGLASIYRTMKIQAVAT